MQDPKIAPRRLQAASDTQAAATMQRRVARIGLSIGGGVLSLATLQAPALAGPCSSSAVVVESPDGTTVISADGAVSCIVLPGGDALMSLGGQVTPLVPLGAPSGSTTYTYDSVGQLPSEHDSLGRTTLTYDFPGGRLASSSDPTGFVTTYTYDGGSNLLESETLPGGRVTTYQYDSSNRLVSEDEAGLRTTFTYDAGEVIETGPAHTITTFVYDTAGDITEVINPLHLVTTYVYDAGDQLADVVDPLHLRTTYAYDTGGTLQSEKDPLGRITTFSYDQAGQVLNDDGNYDHVVSLAYVAGVPEPSTLALLLSGLAGWAKLRRRKNLSRFAGEVETRQRRG
jgi:YD repeat-containing protein